MSEQLPPYRFRWIGHAVRITIGNFIALTAVAVFAALELLPFWLIVIPIGIHLAIMFAAWKNNRTN
jgi:hypothetical protein